VNILIADDSAVSLRLLAAVLERWGHGVVTASTGTEAWDVLQRDDAPRLAILDWMMPGYTGPELCSLIRQRAGGAYTYVILLTARNQREDIIRGLEAGADDYLVKPFDNSELRVRLGAGCRILELQEQLLQAQEALRVQATRDSITGLWNRFAIFDILARELARAGRENKPLGVVMGDLDRFKNINDSHGHLAGDLVLKEVAGRMVRSIRTYDALGRYGGEEFLLLLPGCDGPMAMQSAQRMREAVRAEPILLTRGGAEVPLNITMSFGVTALEPGAETNSEGLVRVADAALYQAKENGRDQCRYLPCE
jgi:diguanylate cyclase (GGDEF)-like protein